MGRPLLWAAVFVCLASYAYPQTDLSNRTPNLHLLYTSDQKLNQNFGRLDEVLGGLTAAFDPTSPLGIRFGYVPDNFGFFDAARSPQYDLDITKNDPLGLVLQLFNTGPGQVGYQLRGPLFEYLTFVLNDASGGYTLGLDGSKDVTTVALTISNRNNTNPNFQLREPDGATQISNDLYPDIAGNGHQPTDILRFYGSKGQNTTGTTGQLAGSGIQSQVAGGAGGNAPAGSTNGSGGHASLIGGDAGSGLGTSGTPGNAIVNAGNNARGAAGKAFVLGGNATGTAGGNVILQGGSGTVPGGVQVATTVTAATAVIQNIYTATVAWPNATVPAATCSSQTVTVTGATDHDLIALGVANTAISGSVSLVFQAYVSAADTVKVSGCCINGPCASTGGTIRVMVFKVP